MFGWFKPRPTPVEPEPPRLASRVTALENLCDDFESRIDYLSAELKKVRGRQFALEKRAQDDPGPTNDPDQLEIEPAPRLTSTAHLARRFKQGG